MEIDKRLAAANLLLERGVRFNITDAPFYFRFIGLKTIIIRPLYPGTIMELSRVILEDGLEKIDSEKAVEKMESVCRVIAIAMLNDRNKIKRTERLTHTLMDKVPLATLIRIFLHIADINGVMDFTLITSYFSGLMNQMMTVKNLGQIEGS